MLDTRPPVRPVDHPSVAHRSDARRLVATDYSRQQIAGAIHESLVEALHVRFSDLAADERTWVREWLVTAVPSLTERTVNGLATHLEAALSTAPAGVIESLDERRRRAILGVE
jgi:hypothetical protein